MYDVPWLLTCTLDPEFNVNCQPQAVSLVSKSLFRNILRISILDSKIWRELFCKSMIPKDRDIRGEGTHK